MLAEELLSLCVFLSPLQIQTDLCELGVLNFTFAESNSALLFAGENTVKTEAGKQKTRIEYREKKNIPFHFLHMKNRGEFENLEREREGRGVWCPVNQKAGTHLLGLVLPP